MWFLFLRFIVPILGIFYGTSLIADEVEDKTITYLFTRPISRSAVLIGKYLAYLASTVLIVLPSVMLVYFLVVPVGGASIAATFPNLLRDLVLLAVGLAVYGALFAAVGAWIKRPVLIGLFFAFGWENFALALPGYLKRFTIAFYTQGLVPHTMPQENLLSMLQSFFRESVGPVQARRDAGGDCRGVAWGWPRGRSNAGNTSWSNDLGRIPELTFAGDPYTSLEDVLRMTKRTRYFMFGSVTVLLVGLCTGLVAYYTGMPMGAFGQTEGPSELQYVPADAVLVAYANVQDVMRSELRKKLHSTMARKHDDKGQEEFQKATGIDIEHDIDRVVAFMEPSQTRTVQRHGARDRPLRRGAPRGTGPRARRPGGGLQGQAADHARPGRRVRATSRSTASPSPSSARASSASARPASSSTRSIARAARASSPTAR